MMRSFYIQRLYVTNYKGGSTCKDFWTILCPIIEWVKPLPKSASELGWTSLFWQVMLVSRVIKRFYICVEDTGCVEYHRHAVSAISAGLHGCIAWLTMQCPVQTPLCRRLSGNTIIISHDINRVLKCSHSLKHKYLHESKSIQLHPTLQKFCPHANLTHKCPLKQIYQKVHPQS